MSPVRMQRVKIGPYEGEVPLWLIQVLAFLLVVGLLVWGYFWLASRMNADLAAISPADKFQMSESQRHFAEAPSVEFTAYDDDRGALRLRVYSTDGCIGTIRRVGATGPNQVQWLGDPSRAAPPPQAAALAPDLTLSSAAYAGGEKKELYCACSFEGEFVQSEGERHGEWIRLYRSYRHGCSFWWMRNTVYNFDEADENGRPVLHFMSCAHS